MLSGEAQPAEKAAVPGSAWPSSLGMRSYLYNCKVGQSHLPCRSEIPQGLNEMVLTQRAASRYPATVGLWGDC